MAIEVFSLYFLHTLVFTHHHSQTNTSWLKIVPLGQRKDIGERISLSSGSWVDTFTLHPLILANIPMFLLFLLLLVPHISPQYRYDKPDSPCPDQRSNHQMSFLRRRTRFPATNYFLTNKILAVVSFTRCRTGQATQRFQPGKLI